MGAAPLGPLLMLGAASVWALGTVPTKLLAPHVPPLTQVTWQMALGAIPLAGALLASGGASLAGADAMVWTLIAANVAFGLVVPYLIWFALLGRLPASIASVCVLLSPCFGVISSALTLGERVGVAEILALGFVLAAIATALLFPA